MTTRIVAITLAGIVAAGLAGCDTGGGREQRVQATGSPSPAPTLGTSARDLAEFAGVELPSDAENPAITARRNDAGNPVYQARFTTTRKSAEAFCSGNGLGGSLPRVKPLDDETRRRFGIQGDSAERPRECTAGNPKDQKVQREVIVTFPDDDTAAVHLLAFLIPG